ncbi:uncharacterized protein LOC117095254 [Trachypithecus francoisi]|uniref:uncharacterized protein LOC117095254 n=1 Tax=Trachypithecus francoisi TaxID=54180 RepID=UPI00141B0E7B|nr:uncharacterized protein LOC117095254 [Trachypithecus francoisi]
MEMNLRKARAPRKEFGERAPRASPDEFSPSPARERAPSSAITACEGKWRRLVHPPAGAGVLGGNAGEPGSGPESPLQAAPDHEPLRRFSALRAFPPALCVLARVGRNAGTRAVLCACARGQAVRPAWSREWARLPAAPPRPAFAPPLTRHFVLRRVLCARRAGPPRDGRPEVGTTNAQAPGLRCLQVILLPAERRWRLELAAVPKSRCARTRACKNLVVHRSRCLRDPGMYVDPRVQAPPPLSVAH